MDTTKVIKHPLSTEKSIRLMESENKLAFVVDMQANKSDVKKAVEDAFKAAVTKVNIYVGPKGYKRAYVTFAPESPAIDIATKMGLM